MLVIYNRRSVYRHIHNISNCSSNFQNEAIILIHRAICLHLLWWVLYEL